VRYPENNEPRLSPDDANRRYHLTHPHRPLSELVGMMSDSDRLLYVMARLRAAEESALLEEANGDQEIAHAYRRYVIRDLLSSAPTLAGGGLASEPSTAP
jgi:hypothetical protein